jgi:hypothetical protein
MKGGGPQGKKDSMGGTELVAPTMETEDNQIPSPVNRDQLVKDQHEDPGLAQVRADAYPIEEVENVAVGYYIDRGLLMRKWRFCLVPANETWQEVHQVVIPQKHRKEVLKLAHENPLSGHLGVNKTVDRIRRYFYWPRLQADVQAFCKVCHTCQVAGKPNENIPVAPLKPIPVIGEPFQKIIVDCVGPLPKSKSGHEYLITIMCVATRYPEAFPLRNITARQVIPVMNKFFTTFGFPKEVQSDQGSNFMSKEFQKTLKGLGIQHVVASAYHPESQGALERFHQTLKSMLRKLCIATGQTWDKGLQLLLFAIREVQQKSLGFSPNELFFWE